MTRLARRAGGALSLPRRRVAREHETLEARLIWILGSPRTGSTWLLRLLIHPLRTARTPAGVSAPADAGRRDWPSVVPVNESHMFQHLMPIVRETRAAPKPGDDVSRSRVRRSLQEHHSYLFADAYSDAWMPSVRQLVLSRLGAQADVAARELAMSDPLVVIKEPQSLGAESVLPLLPRSRLVFLQRDGLDVLRSMLALYGPGGRLDRTVGALDRGSEEPRHRFVREQAERWVRRTKSVQEAYELHSPERRTVVRYEDFTDDTVAALDRLTSWMGLGRTNAQLRAAVEHEAERRRPTGTGRRSDEREGVRDPRQWELTAAEREIAEKIMGPTLGELGYPT